MGYSPMNKKEPVMKKEKIRLVHLVVLAVAAMFVFASCGDGGGGGYTIIQGDPSNAELSSVGLNSSKFNTLKGIGGYYGYIYDDSYGVPGLVLFYKEKNEAAFNSAKTTLNSVFELSGGDQMSANYTDEEEIYSGSGGSMRVDLFLYKKNDSFGGIYLPAGTMVISIEPRGD